ncbi:cobalamin adenosyltransferase [Desulforamulus reducens MI-1]|uniref:Cobalamin adenosyltransferase n=1 Tax=Desulforamulus reducens (strain ATCC BAA-1160 / DSM 100696 / MI-1) TaxID=349161 RepID=A4J431_DESRM|nr:cobalamin adenosyltransferase [Desulforamulus reducens]ABO49834.1 cobalamin adenosyltransferase [Desulforamulus reducens MI-1]
MRVFTELELRDQYFKNPFATFHLPPNCRLTPAATQFLNERKIKVVTGENPSPAPSFTDKQVECKGTAREKGYLLPNGQFSEKKPEHMTQLKGKNLVDKRHPVIRLRGKLDSFQALAIDTIIDLQTFGYGQMAKELEEVLTLARAVLRAEVTGEELPEPGFAGLTSNEIREISHHPDKHLGVKHFLPSPAHGKIMARLNLLRTSIRETELVAADGFVRENGETERKDIMETLNRMSSMIYIMMCKLLAGKSNGGETL